MDQPTAKHALRQLEPLVGEWALEGKWPDGEPWPGGGRVTFEWHASGAHLLERGTAEHPEAPDNVSIIGCDAANGTYFQLYSDERGVEDVLIVVELRRRSLLDDQTVTSSVTSFRSRFGGAASRA
jgi:hypothetical protein